MANNATATEHKKALECYFNDKSAEAIDIYDELAETCASPLVLCNRAAAWMKMELYRRCIKDCTKAIQLDPTCISAYILKGKAQKAMKKINLAKKTWKAGTEQIGDVCLLEILHNLLNNVDTNANNKQPPKAATKQPNTSTHITATKATSPNDDMPSLENETDTLTLTTKKQDPPKEDTNVVITRPTIQHGVGQKSIDEKIALGYLQVNTGKYAKGIETFNQLLKQNSRLIAAYLGRGTAFALTGDLTGATRDFTRAIAVDNNCVDAWKRRGQARAANGHDNDAVFDLSRAIKLAADYEGHHQRGLVYYKLKNYRRALADFRKACSFKPTCHLSWNYCGLCLNATGASRKALDAHKTAVEILPSFKEAWANYALAYRELGLVKEAEQNFTKALELDPNYAHAFHLRALTKFSSGRHLAAITDLKKGLSLKPDHFECLYILAICQQALGLFEQGFKSFAQISKIKPDHVAFYHRQIIIYFHNKIDKPWRDYNMDMELDKYMKEAWCKRLPPNTLRSYKAFKKPSSWQIVSVKPKLSEETKKLKNLADYFGKYLQNNCDGYVPNKRQWRMCGFAAIEIAQKFKALFVDKDQSALPVSGKSSSGITKPHDFNWRDLYDITVRWRQVSEPNDPVWWVDLLSPEQFEEGFGSHTPLITGQCNVIRYYPMFNRAFKIMKELMLQQCNLTEKKKQEVRDAKQCKDLYILMEKDFWVVTPCFSTARAAESHIHEGTRITIQYVAPEGYEYSIRTPGTPPRWKDYEAEMDFVWNSLAAEANKHGTDDYNFDEVSKWILTLTFYWYNFMPLARGTAACGFTAMMGMFLGMGYEIKQHVPKGQQIDWEAILTPRAQDFIDSVSWILEARTPTDALSKVPQVAETIVTLRNAIEVLNDF